ncbi:acyl-phosphate glycerol 3-phosphate acyltransferase [Gammaproteobacteria bacterium 45_16_T64]|nr:acyl-phosphate glycerol 3-phosphate acyltransferase [Gammaproteobacteria bacterium 45_16_T64]
MGSISSAILICRVLGYPDPRSTGSQNPGATNVLRVAGKIAAGATLLGDVAKGVLPILIAMELNAPPLVLALCGLCAFLGHLYPVYFDFRGGKGVATALGVVLTLHLPTGLLIITTWLATMAATRTASVAALISWAFAPFFFQLTAPNHLQSSYLPIIATLSLLLILTHRSNMLNLYRGEEHRFEDTPQSNAQDQATTHNKNDAS